MSPRICLALTLSLLSTHALWAFIDYPYAVTFQTVRVPMMPLYETAPGEGRWALRSSTRWINVWSYQLSRFVVDGEELQLEPAARYGLTAHVQVGGSIPLKSQGGGTLDGPIQGFHRAFGFTQDHRESYPRNTFNVSYEPLGPYYGFIDRDPVKTFARAFTQRLYPRTHLDPPVQLAGFDVPGRPASETIVGPGRSQSGVSDPRFFIQWQALGTDVLGIVL
ncbi:MAG: DUF3187 family protein, partial [Spirochaetia bacterium]|nr:DUF3187 family protein [Spirochaetia bacterium]